CPFSPSSRAACNRPAVAAPSRSPATVVAQRTSSALAALTRTAAPTNPTIKGVARGSTRFLSQTVLNQSRPFIVLTQTLREANRPPRLALRQSSAERFCRTDCQSVRTVSQSVLPIKARLREH